MKRASRLLEAVLTPDNFRLAFRAATRGKRRQAEVVRFGSRLEDNLGGLIERLRAGAFRFGTFTQFLIRDPKPRVITAPCLRERIIHHAIVNVFEPDFERWLITDTFACRKGKGRIAALLRTRRFAGRFGTFLKLDVRKYFDSVPHDRLLGLLGRRFKDGRLLDLFERIVRSFRGALGRGLPIGALTSQHFANFYLGHFDRFVKETLRVEGYVRYMDDMALWADDEGRLKAALRDGEGYLRDELGLALKPTPYLNRTAHGMDFLGCRVFPHHMTLNRRSRVRFRRKMTALEGAYLSGDIDEAQLQQRGTALTAFTRTSGLSAWKFRRAAIDSLPASGRMARTG